MRQNYLVLILLILNSCVKKTETKKQPKIDLKTEFENLTKKMSDIDTIQMTMKLGMCNYKAIEEHIITRKNDSIIFNGKRIETETPITNFKEVKISITDSTLRLNEFIKKNKFRTENCFNDSRRLTIKSDSTYIFFCSNGITNSFDFIMDYQNIINKIYLDRKNLMEEVAPPPPPSEFKIKYKTDE